MPEVECCARCVALMERGRSAGKVQATREAFLWAKPKAKHVQVRLAFELSKKGLNSRFSG